MNMRVFRPHPDHHYTVIADGSALQTIPAGSGLHTFPTQVIVHGGDFVGIRSTFGVCAHGTGNGADTFYFHQGAALAVGDEPAFIPNAGAVWDISARLEDDADGDGFGDETQDQCPTNASTHGPCPVTPVTSAKKKKCKKKKKNHSAESAKKKKCKKKKK